jgi:putative flavoprotein involved in K+ transport
MIRSADIQESGAADVVIIGAGHSGLAISRILSGRSIDHVILERGRVANSWRKERWDSLRLLTPNWMTRLPGLKYSGPDPDGFMNVSEIVRFISGYARFAGAPVITGTTVTSVHPLTNGFWVRTNRGAWRARAVIIASGAFNIPAVPRISEGVPSSVHQVTTNAYRNPAQLPDGGVLVVGASATGLQLAQEIHASGRPVTLSVGEHVRLPRMYRGRDIQYWMKAIGTLDQSIDEVDDMNRVRKLPSPQLVGSPNRRTLDLNELTNQGVELVGRLAGIRDGRAQYSGSLRNVCKLADLKMNRLLDSIDDWIGSRGAMALSAVPLQRFDSTRVDASPRLESNLTSGEIETIVWATGFRPDYSWLDVPVLDRKGFIRHDGGVAEFPGIYVLGLPFLRRRKSSFIHGAEDDARDICDHLCQYLDETARPLLRMAV